MAESTAESETESEPWEPPPLPLDRRVAAWLVCFASFFAASVDDGFGPMQTVYLVGVEKWTPGKAGLLWAVREFTSMLCSPVVGWLYDVIPRKRLLFGTCIFFLSGSVMVIVFTADFRLLLLRNLCGGFLAAALKPGVSVLLLEIAGHESLPAWQNRAEMLRHSGTVLTLLCAGFASYWYYPHVQSLFVVFGGFIFIASICVACIPWSALRSCAGGGPETLASGAMPGAVDTNEGALESTVAAAEGALECTSDSNSDSGDVVIRKQTSLTEVAVSYYDLLWEPQLMLWAVVNFLTHFANAPVLPLSMQVMTDAEDREAMLWSVAMIIIANFISVPIAAVLQPMSRQFGWKGVAWICWGMIVPRCLLIVLLMQFADSSKPGLLSTAVLDGFGVASHGLVFTVVTSILMQGTEKFGSAVGLVHGFHQGGAALGNLAFGYIANRSYELAFLGAAVVGCVGLLLIIPLRLESITSRDRRPGTLDDTLQDPGTC